MKISKYEFLIDFIDENEFNEFLLGYYEMIKKENDNVRDENLYWFFKNSKSKTIILKEKYSYLENAIIDEYDLLGKYYKYDVEKAIEILLGDNGV